MVKDRIKKTFRALFPSVLLLIFAVVPVLAADFGTDVVDESIGLAATDPRIIIGKIIQIALGVLSALALGIILYAGFLWMTSNGEEEKISKAKQFLKNGVIGLAIILSAWGIVVFVLNRLNGDNSQAGNQFVSTYIARTSFGTSAIGSCSIESVYPQDGQKDVARNTAIMINFKEPLSLSSVCQDDSGNACDCSSSCNRLTVSNINISRQEGESGIAASVSATSDRKTLMIRPDSYLGDTSGASSYLVTVSDGVLNSNGDSIFSTCGNSQMSWSFSVSNKIDLEPPYVLVGGVFPSPDSQRDSLNVSSPATSAIGYFEISGCPVAYSPAKVISVKRVSGNNDLEASVSSDFQSRSSSLVVSVQSDSKTVQLSSGGELMGSAEFSGDVAEFSSGLSIRTTSYEAGNSWEISVSPMQSADSIQVGGSSYTFADTNAGMNILLPENCTISSLVANIYAKISGHDSVYPSISGNRIIITAKVAGESGNSIVLSSTSEKLKAVAMSGGAAASSQDSINGVKDKPTNSIIQINFSEAMNPLVLSGSTEEMAPYIRVVNINGLAARAGSFCSQDSECLSYDCRSGACVGSYVSGSFVMSSSFKTVEFISNKECGQNSCGEKVYCLPESSNLAVELISASPIFCSSDNDCQQLGAYNKCDGSCRDSAGHIYPASSLSPLSGIMDAALNSLDGNRDSYISGPSSYYYENAKDARSGDNYRWSFFLRDGAEIGAPYISYISPSSDSGTDVSQAVGINFNNLMMNSTLKTGEVETTVNGITASQKLINLYSSGDSGVGYWVGSKNSDVSPLDGEPDVTTISIGHSSFLDDVTYRSQIGSGVKDIYQNCFKPSSGVSCVADENNPSCCFGQATSDLDEDGNCK